MFSSNSIGTLSFTCSMVIEGMNEEESSEQDQTVNDELAQLVRKWNSGDKIALDRLVDLLYDELRLIARAHLK